MNKEYKSYSELPKEQKLLDDVCSLLDTVIELQDRIDKVIDDLNDTLEINKHIKIGNNELVQLDIDHIKKIIDILRGEE